MKAKKTKKKAPRKQYNPEIRTSIYPKYDEYHKKTIESINTWQTHKENITAVKSFQNSLYANARTSARVSKLTTQIKWHCDQLNKTIIQTNHKDAEDLIIKVRQKETWRETTKKDYIRTLKQFFNWYEEEDPRLTSKDLDIREDARKLYKYLDKHKINNGKNAHKSLEEADIITEDDADKLIQACKNSMEKAVICTLHSTGIRLGELLGMRIKDVQIKENHGLIKVSGKTGTRKVPILKPIPYMLKWLEEHPHKDNQNALLWISKSNKFYGKPLIDKGIIRIIERAINNAGLKKKHNPHWFRHSRATLWSMDYTEALLCKLMGWVIGSKQSQTYIHLNQRDVENNFLQQNGIIQKAEQQAPKQQKCLCGTINEASAQYCFKCGKPLSVKVLLESQDKIKQAEKEAEDVFLTQIAKDPEILNKFMALWNKLKETEKS